MFCAQSAADPKTALYREINGEMADWDLRTQLAAHAVNALNAIVWQNGSPVSGKQRDIDEHEKRRPRLIGPPGTQPKKPQGPTAKALADFRARTRYAEGSD